MKEKQDYLKDLAEIRSMMERSSKFLSLSGWSGILAGLYALAGAFIAYSFFDFNPDRINYLPANYKYSGYNNVLLLGLTIMVLALGTAVLLSHNKAKKKGEGIWNASSKNFLVNLAIPLFTGGALILILIAHGLLGLIAPLTLLFYGLALFNAGKFTFDSVKFLGLIQIVLGLVSALFVEFSLVLWALGFGVIHIIYGIYIHFRYEK